MSHSTDTTEDNSLTVDQLAEAFLHRRRSGESPTIDEYVEAHPLIADEIRDVFPALLAMESLKTDWEQSQHDSAAQNRIPVEKLGDYRLLKEIGRGGMGVVYEAIQESLGRQVAVKLLPQHALTDPSYVRRLQREAKTAAALHHSNVVPVFGVGEEGGYHYVVMQLINGAALDHVISLLRKPDGPSLAESISSLDDSTLADGVVGLLIEEAKSELPTQATGTVLSGMLSQQTSALNTQPIVNDGAVSHHESHKSASKTSVQTQNFSSGYWRLVARLGGQIANALHHAHQHGTLHRDIKPGNILLDVHGAVWVTDFGLAHATDGSNATQSGHLVGTLSYMAPEQFEGRSDERSDVYSLGLTLYELATLQPAFASGTRAETIRQVTVSTPIAPRTINPKIPADLETIILKAIAREPKHRYETARCLEDDLIRFREDRPIEARRVSVMERIWRWCRRNPAVATSTAACCTLLIAATVAAVFGYAHEAQQRQKLQSTLNISLNSLESVFQRFLPDQIALSSQPLNDLENDANAMTARAALSPDAAAMLEDLLPAFDQLAQQFHDNSLLKANAAQANRRVGDIHAQLANYERAIPAYEESLRRYALLNGENDYRADRAAIHNDIGNARRQQGRLRDAELSYQNAIQTLLATPTSTVPGKSENLTEAEQFQLARTYYLLGQRGLPQQSIGPPEDYSGRPPLGPGRRGGPPARDGRRPGDHRPERHRPADDFVEAETPLQKSSRNAWLDRSIAELEQLQRKSDTSECSYLRALCLRDRSTGPESEDLDAAIELLETLTTQYPDTARYRHALIGTYLSFSLENLAADEITVALKRMQPALKHAEELVSSRPDIAAYVLTAAHTNHRMSIVLRESARSAPMVEHQLVMEEALQHAYRAVELQRQATERGAFGPGEAFWLFRFSDALAEMFLMDRRPALALSTLNKTLSEMRDRKSPDLQPNARATYDRHVDMASQRVRALKELRPGP